MEADYSSCSDDWGGTSGACPLAAGIVKHQHEEMFLTTLRTTDCVVVGSQSLVDLS